MSLLGAWLAKREGLGVLRRIQAALDRGQTPSTEVVDGGLILLAGALMIAPGFISDVLALLLLLPPTRAIVRVPVAALRHPAGRVAVGTGSAGFQRHGRHASATTVASTSGTSRAGRIPPSPRLGGELGRRS